MHFKRATVAGSRAQAERIAAGATAVGGYHDEAIQPPWTLYIVNMKGSRRSLLVHQWFGFIHGSTSLA